MSFGWAYVGCDDISVTSMIGPSGSVLVRTGPFAISGSANYKLLDEGNQIHSLLLTGSLKIKGNTAMEGNLVVAGNLTANSYTAVHTSVTEIEASGSTTFGNDYADKHVLTGSFAIAAGLDGGAERPAFMVSASATTMTSKVGVNTNAPTSNFAVSGSVALNYMSFNSSTVLDSLQAIVGISTNSAITLTLPSAANTPGRIIYIKDEGVTQPRTTGNKITISPQSGETIDGQTHDYYIMGSNAAISLYSNGDRGWFVF